MQPVCQQHIPRRLNCLFGFSIYLNFSSKLVSHWYPCRRKTKERKKFKKSFLWISSLCWVQAYVPLTVLNIWQLLCTKRFLELTMLQDKALPGYAFDICCNFLCVHSVLPTCVTEKVLETLWLHLGYILFLRVMFVMVTYIYLEIDV